MLISARTSAKTLFVAAGAAGFVALGNGFAAADTLEGVTGGIDTGVPAALPAVDTAVPAADLPQLGAVDAPALDAPQANDVLGLAHSQVDSVDVTVPRVNVPEIDADTYLEAAEATTFPAQFLVNEAQRDVEFLVAEAAFAAGSTVDGVDADLEVVDNVDVPNVPNVPNVPEVADVPDVDTDIVDTEVPAVGDVEETVGGADVDGLTDEVVDTDIVDTEVLDTDAVDTDVVDTDTVDTDLVDGLV